MVFYGLKETRRAWEACYDPHQQTPHTKQPYQRETSHLSKVLAFLLYGVNVNVVHFQTPTTLLTVLSTGAKTNFLLNSWSIFFKFLKVNLGLDVRRSKILL